MVAATTTSIRGTSIARTFSAAFVALQEHAKHHPAEAAELALTIQSHLKAAFPMTTLVDTGPMIRVEPVAETALRVTVNTDGAAYEIRIDDSFVRVQLWDVTGDNAMVHFEPAKAVAFRDDLGRVLASIGGGG
jgi:hypothetical protein